jgi:hypothetical protein
VSDVRPPAAEPGLDDLRPWAQRAFEDVYRQTREQASREDIAYGFIQALRWARVWSAFRRAGWPASR